MSKRVHESRQNTKFEVTADIGFLFYSNLFEFVTRSRQIGGEQASQGMIISGVATKPLKGLRARNALCHSEAAERANDLRFKIV